MWGIWLLIGLVFAPLAAVMAFVITYIEWERHQLPRAELIARSLHMADVTFAFFVLLALAVGAALAFAIPGRPAP
jgi:hypothetical protein